MKKLERWLRQKKLNPKRVYMAVLALLFVCIIVAASIALLTPNNDKVRLTEDAELRTGPNAAYPVLYKVEEGDTFKILSRSGKWIEVASTDHKQKGWIAGWHTNLDIKEDVDPNARPLKNKVIVLDPGHGGGDQGASSRTGKKTLEKDVTLKTSLELKKRLEKEGAIVKLTRKDDTYVKLKDRKATGDIFISIHNDALESADANGATVYWYHKNQEALANTLNASIQKKALLTDRGSRQENYQVLRQTKKPAVLLELGYISNPTDETLINDKNHRYIVESAIVDGLKNYFLYQ
ncbi:N-acetylmuramoyl-L-alanine amidase [Staphylococcus americanisciuri]|uniref:N-acetylmuramoyl-L-alanine amidase n=1 Tax=Staphylococcus americanisciuri TaxID=2973940 RepID=A0ABT2EZP8_9STAP|nr:N-acetylmuramoyl-L-alanine amidase [Staphylococcus americanisciuri]MCS4485624.1 N-acetylmuramoyl-L-alanine amidase [Staphylococcus americanisciuri]